MLVALWWGNHAFRGSTPSCDLALEREEKAQASRLVPSPPPAQHPDTGERHLGARGWPCSGRPRSITSLDRGIGRVRAVGSGHGWDGDGECGGESCGVEGISRLCCARVAGCLCALPRDHRDACHPASDPARTAPSHPMTEYTAARHAVAEPTENSRARRQRRAQNFRHRQTPKGACWCSEGSRRTADPSHPGRATQETSSPFQV